MFGGRLPAVANGLFAARTVCGGVSAFWVHSV